MSTIDWDIILAELACGMDQLLYPEAREPSGSIYPAALRRGCSRLAAAMLRAGAIPPVDIPDTIELLNRPVGAWQALPAPPEHLREIILMDGEEITDDGDNYIVANPDIAGESTQTLMKRVVRNCLARGDQGGYILFRRWIIEHPVASRRELIEVRRKLSDPDLRNLFDEAYEVVPTSPTAGSGVRTCRRCGWTLLEDANRATWRCSLSRCRELEGFLPNQHSDHFPSDSDVRRVQRGLARYTTLPGKLEMRLYNSLERIRGLTVELWPSCDAYDIGFEFHDGRRWAVDCKDARNPVWRAHHLNQSQIPTSRSEERAFYVFPAYHRKLNPDYARAFSSRWQPRSAQENWSFDDEFLRKVRGRLASVK